MKTELKSAFDLFKSCMFKTTGNTQVLNEKFVKSKVFRKSARENNPCRISSRSFQAMKVEQRVGKNV